MSAACTFSEGELKKNEKKTIFKKCRNELDSKTNF